MYPCVHSPVFSTVSKALFYSASYKVINKDGDIILVNSVG